MINVGHLCSEVETKFLEDGHSKSNTHIMLEIYRMS